MVVELIGGPLDGTIIEADKQATRYMVLTSHEEAPVYRAGSCTSRDVATRCMPYYFLGYEQELRYAYPQKF